MTPREVYRSDPDRVKWHHTVFNDARVDSAFHCALAQYAGAIAGQTDSGAQLQGIVNFLRVLKTLADTPPEPPKRTAFPALTPPDNSQFNPKGPSAPPK